MPVHPLRLAAPLITMLVAAPAPASIVAVDPFQGDASEAFEDAAVGFHPALDVLFTEPTTLGESNAQMIPAFVTSGSSFAGSTITAHEGLLFAHSTSPVMFAFDVPVQLFGGWVATNSGASGGLVEFFDAEGDLLGTMPLDVTFQAGSAPYTWNGWLSDVPFAGVRVSSNGVLGGFLGFDDLEMSFVPAPGAFAALGLAPLAGRRRRSR
jgi:hypothetical protein